RRHLPGPAGTRRRTRQARQVSGAALVPVRRWDEREMLAVRKKAIEYARARRLDGRAHMSRRHRRSTVRDSLPQRQLLHCEKA
ncbi:MAG: hypothetical protein ABTQ29_05180, partial [Siculibacillus sp.]